MFKENISSNPGFWKLKALVFSLLSYHEEQQQIYILNFKAKQWFIWSTIFYLPPPPEALNASGVIGTWAIIKGLKGKPIHQILSKVLSLLYYSLSKSFHIQPPLQSAFTFISISSCLQRKWELRLSRFCFDPPSLFFTEFNQWQAELFGELR